jgi:hypothetical protein
MARVRPVHWLSGQASAGVKELPRNGAWLLSRIVGSPRSAAGSTGGAATDAARRVSAAVVDALPGARDSVEQRLKRAEAAARMKKDQLVRSIQRASRTKARA